MLAYSRTEGCASPPNSSYTGTPRCLPFKSQSAISIPLMTPMPMPFCVQCVASTSLRHSRWIASASSPMIVGASTSTIAFATSGAFTPA